MTAVAKNKWRLPEDVTRLNTQDLNRNHVVVLLDYLGVPTYNQPKDKTRKAELLKEKIDAEPKKAQVGYNSIVLGKMPEADQKIIEDAEAMKAHFYGVMSKALAGEQAEAMRTGIEKHVETMAARIRGGLEDAAKRALAAAAQNYRPVVIKTGGKEKKVKGVLPKEFETIVQLASARVPVMLVGPAGCGKSYMAEKVAEALDLDFADQSCSEGVSETTFVGLRLPMKGGAFEYVESPFVHAYENGGVFCLEEMDAADPNLLVFLNKAIANKFFYLPQRHEKPKVVKHEDFVVVAAANTYGHGANAQYVGRNALDAATLDRFRAGMVKVDYSAEVETALVAGGVLEWGLRVRNFIGQNQLRRIMSTRVMLDLTKMHQMHGWERDQWERAYFSDWSVEELAKWQRFDQQSKSAAELQQQIRSGT